MSRKNTNKKDTLTEQQREKAQIKIMKQLDPTMLKQSIYLLKVQLLELINTHQEIQQERSAKNDQYMKETFQLEKTIKAQQENIIQLQNNYNLLVQSYEGGILRSKRDWEEQKQRMLNKHKVEKELVLKDYEIMKKKVEHMAMYKMRQPGYMETLNKLNQKKQMTEESHKRELERIKNIHTKERDQITIKNSKDIDKIKQAEIKKLHAKMSKDQNVKSENQIISEQIQLCETQKQILQDNCQTLLKQIQDSKLGLSSNVLNGQATQTYERSLRLIKIEGKINSLKTTLAQETARLDNQYQKMQQQFNDKEKQYELKFSKLQTAIKMKERDNKKVKGCAQMVLNQRSHLESYLLQVFHEHPEIDYKNPENVNQILRFLFIKINSSKQPISYKNYITPQVQ